MTIYHFEFGKLGRGLSGGENCLIQLIRIFQSKGIKNVLLTTDNAREEYEELGLSEGKLLQYKTIKSEWTENRFGALGSYIIRSKMALRLVKDIAPIDSDILLCNSDFFPNSIPFHKVARRHPNAKRIYWLRMLAPDWFKGFEGHYTNHHRFPSPRFAHYKLSQNLYLKLMPAQSTVLVQNEDFEKRLSRKRTDLNINLLNWYPGRPPLDFNPMTVEKKYDLAWMGRFHAQKGLFQIPTLLKQIKATKNDVSLLLMGGGSKKLEKQLFHIIEAEGLSKNVTYAGYGGAERLKELVQAKAFLLTSSYEGSPNVAVEALTCGLPIICHKLPIFQKFMPASLQSDPLDLEAMANNALQLLTNPEILSAYQQHTITLAEKFSWETIADAILKATDINNPSI